MLLTTEPSHEPQSCNPGWSELMILQSLSSLHHITLAYATPNWPFIFKIYLIYSVCTMSVLKWNLEITFAC